jgi:hypothetical protein
MTMAREPFEQTRLREQLRDLAIHDAGAEPSQAVENEVLRQWAARTASRPRPASFLRRDRRAGWARGLAASAAALAAVWLLAAWLRTEPAAPRTDTEASPHARAAVAGEIEEVAPTGAAGPDPAAIPAPAAPVTMPAREAASLAAAPTRVDVGAEPFVGLLPLLDQEIGALRLARVRLRGPAATLLGLDGRLPAAGPEGFVEADVLLGEDGLARAIRFTR